MPSTLWPWWPSGTFGADEGERHGVEAPLEHRVHVVDQLARDAVLVRGHAELERAHGPLHRRPVQRGEPGADPEGARCPSSPPAGGEDRRLRGRAPAPGSSGAADSPRSRGRQGSVAAHEVGPQRPGRAQGRVRRAESPRAVAGAGVLEQRPCARGGLKAAISGRCRRRPRCLTRPLPASAGQSRQKSGLTHGFCGDAQPVPDKESVDRRHRPRF